MYDHVATPVVEISDFDSPSMRFNAAARAFFSIGAEADRFFVKDYYKQLNRDDLELGFEALADGRPAEVSLILRDGGGVWHDARLAARPTAGERSGRVGAVVTVLVGTEAHATPPEPPPAQEAVAWTRLRDLLWDSPSIGLSVSEDYPTNPLIWNDALYGLLGYESEEVAPSAALYLQHVHHAHRSRLISLCDQFASGELDFWEGDYRMISRSGDSTWVNTRVLAVVDGDGRRPLATIVAPVNDHRSAAYEARAARADLERLTYTVSHDLRAPARQAGSFVDLLLKSIPGELTEDQRTLGTYAQSSISRLTRMIEGLVSYNRLATEGGEPRELRLDRLVGALVEEEFAAVASRIEVSELPIVYGHPGLLRRLFSNLLDNAVKFSRNRPDSPIRITGAPGSAGRASVSVTDFGVGFDAEHVDKLFQVFRRLHGVEEFEGLGLGLAEARRIAEIHGGALTAEGAVGRGVTVTLTLPLPPGD